MKSLRDSKGYRAALLCKMLSDKIQNIIELKTLIKKLITLAHSVDFQAVGARDGPTCTSVAYHTWYHCYRTNLHDARTTGMSSILKNMYSPVQ